MALLPLLLALLTACGGAPRAAAPQRVTIPADIARLVRTSALYPELAHYDRVIAALTASERTWSARARAARIERDRAALAASIGRATASLDAIARQSNAYAARDAATMRALAHGPGSTGAAALAAYRNDLAANERSEIVQAQTDARLRVAQAYALRQEQLYEKTSGLAYRLTQRDAMKAMLARVRASDLHAYAGTRHVARAQLDAIERAEGDALAAQTSRDDATLDAYRAQVAAETSSQLAQTIAEIRRRTAANLATRNASPNYAQPRAADDALQAMRASQPGAVAQASQTRAAFVESQRTVAARFAALARLDDDAARGLSAEIARLRSERAALYDAIAAFLSESARSGERGVLGANAPP